MAATPPISFPSDPFSPPGGPTSSSSTIASSSSSLPDTSSATATSSSTTTSSSSSSSVSSASSTLSSASSLPSSSSSSQSSSVSATSLSQTTTNAPPSSQPSIPPTSTGSLVRSTETDGSVVTITSFESLPSPTRSIAAHQATSKGFFQNKGAVAGVFTVVGLVALVLLIALITNAIRRRQARKFDRDVAEAAREAAASAHARPPEFYDDDFSNDYSYGANRSIYTDQTHGTYSQQPLRPAGEMGESYNMSELPGSTTYDAGAGAAGVGAARLNRSRSATTPYNAFAGPGVQPPSTADNPFHDQTAGTGQIYPGMTMPTAGYPGAYGQPQYGDMSREAGLLDAAGLGTGMAAATGANLAGNGRQQGSTSLHRAKSSGSRTLEAMSASDHGDVYAQPYYSQQAPYGYDTQYGQQQPLSYPPPPAQQRYAPTSQQARPISMATAEDPYGGYISTSPGHVQEEFVASGSPEHSDGDKEDDFAEEAPYVPYHNDQEGDHRMSHGSIPDDYEYGGGRRVLKIVNE